VDVFNLDGTPGLPSGQVRLITRGRLDSPWGLTISPTGFAGISAPHNDPVLLVGNFGNGFINAYDATTGSFLTQLKDPDGEPTQIDHLWALEVGNGGAGGSANTVYFTAGIFDETHGLFGSLTTAAPGSPAGPAEAQRVQADTDVLQLDAQVVINDITSGAPAAKLQQDIQTLTAALTQLVQDENQFAADSQDDQPSGASQEAVAMDFNLTALDELLSKLGKLLPSTLVKRVLAEA
jgi:hypothetical protein